jgi:esterase/lipase
MTEQFFIGIENPVEARRAILEASKSVLQGLQSYEDLREIRKEKVQVAVLAEEQMKEVLKSVRKLRRTLPKLKQPTQKGKKPVTSQSEAKVLEKELSSLEKELTSLKE